jgi:cardiolipin synthase
MRSDTEPLQRVAVELFVGEQGGQFMVDHAQSSYYRLLEAGARIYL